MQYLLLIYDAEKTFAQMPENELARVTVIVMTDDAFLPVPVEQIQIVGRGMAVVCACHLHAGVSERR